MKDNPGSNRAHMMGSVFYPPQLAVAGNDDIFYIFEIFPLTLFTV